MSKSLGLAFWILVIGHFAWIGVIAGKLSSIHARLIEISIAVNRDSRTSSIHEQAEPGNGE